MKLFNKTESPFLSKLEWRKIFTALSIMTIVLYSVAMIFSLNGSDMFIVNYQNSQMDKIETFMKDHRAYSFISCVFLTLEFSILISFIRQKITNIFYPLAFYILAIGIAFLFPNANSLIYTGLGILLTLTIPIIEFAIVYKRFDWKILIRFLIAWAVSFIFQIMIYVIKAGYFSTDNHMLTLSGFFVYSIEYDIALSVVLFTVSLYINREKGDGKLWVTFLAHSGSSQTSKTRLQKSTLKKNLTKRQKNKLFWLWVRLYLIQILGFAIIMILPFVMGKVFEFLVMYFAFAITRYLLGFKYSLHFKNEFLCISVGAVVFGILTLAVPFFYVEMILALTLGVGLAIFLHFSYKYRGFWLFAKMSKPDKFAWLYVIFEGDLSENHILRTCKFKGMSNEDAKIVFEYMEGYKLSYLAYRFNYSVKTLDRKLNEAIDMLNS